MTTVTGICEHCGKYFEKTGAGVYRKFRFCSVTCANVYNAKRLKRQREKQMGVVEIVEERRRNGTLSENEVWISNIEAAARKVGMHYGQYVGRMNIK